MDYKFYVRDRNRLYFPEGIKRHRQFDPWQAQIIRDSNLNVWDANDMDI